MIYISFIAYNHICCESQTHSMIVQYYRLCLIVLELDTDILPVLFTRRPELLVTAADVVLDLLAVELDEARLFEFEL